MVYFANFKMILFLVVGLNMVSFSQSFFHPKQKAMGYSFSSSTSDSLAQSSHKFYVSSGIGDLFASYSNLHKGEECIRMGLTVYSIADSKRFYPSYSVFALKENDNFGAGISTSLPLKVYSTHNFDIIPEIGASIYFFDFTKDLLSSGKTCLSLGTNIGYKLARQSILTIHPSYKYTHRESSFDIGVGLIYVIGLWH